MKTEDKNIFKILAYLGFFILLLIILRNEAKNNKIIKSDEIDQSRLTLFDDIDIDNYSLEVHAISEDDAITLKYEKQKDVIIGEKHYHGEEIKYVQYNNEYYVFNNENFIKNPEFISFNYDNTFIKLKNIKKLFGLKYNISIDGSIKKINFSLKDVINLYNEINNTNLYIIEDDDFYVYLKINENSVDYFVIDMTKLNELTNIDLTTNLYYKISVKSEKETDISFIISNLR